MIDVVRDNTANASGLQGPPQTSRRVAIVVYGGVGLFELGVALDVFGRNDLTDFGVPWYELSVCGVGSAPLSVDGGLHLHVPHQLGRIRRVDTVVVPPTDRRQARPLDHSHRTLTERRWP